MTRLPTSKAIVLLAILLGACRADRQKEVDRLLAAARDGVRQGELASAEEAANRGMALAAATGDPVLEWKFRLVFCEASLRKQSAASALAMLQRPMPDQAAFAPLATRRKMLEGEALVKLGRLTESGAALEAAHQSAAAAQDEQTLAEIENRQGVWLIRQGQWDAGEDTLNRALKRAQSRNLPYEAATALVNLGMGKVLRHHYDEAIGYFSLARAADISHASSLYNVAQANLATCYTNLGEYDRAIQIQLQAIAQHERSGAKLYLQAALGETGRAYEQKDDQKNAGAYLERALAIAGELGQAGDAAIWAGNLSMVHAELKEWDKAEHFNNEAIRIKTANGLHTLVYNTLNMAQIAIGRGQFAEGERLYREAIAKSKDDPAVLWEAHSKLGRSAMLQRRPAVAIREFESAVTIVEQTRAELLSTESKLPFLTRLIQFYQWYVDALSEQSAFDRALAVADSSRAQTLAGRYESAPVRRLPASSFAKIAQHAGVTILTYWLGERQSHAWVITPGGVRHVALCGEREIIQQVESYNDAVAHRLVDPKRTRIPAGERLYQMLVEPVRQWLPAGAHIVLVPDGVLSGLNFEMLPVPSGFATRYWIEDVTIAIAPSINLLGRATAVGAKGHGLLIIGDPASDDPEYPRLARAGAEIAEVTRHFAADSRVVRQGKDAAPQAYAQANPSQFEAIHFTAHAVANRDNPLNSAVLLTGGRLYARDVLGLPLHADLVTLSACRGVGSRTYTGEGTVGFAWAFLHAGARSVIAGLWDVNDQSTADLMDVLYRELAAGKRPADALRTAKMSLIESPGNFRKPYYWGPFQVYTD